MAFLRNIVTGLRSLFRKEQVNRELDEELGEYLEMATDEKMKQGMSRQDALRAVRLERGSLEVSKEIVRSGGWESLVHEFRLNKYFLQLERTILYFQWLMHRSCQWFLRGPG